MSDMKTADVAALLEAIAVEIERMPWEEGSLVPELPKVMDSSPLNVMLSSMHAGTLAGLQMAANRVRGIAERHGLGPKLPAPEESS